MQAFLAELPGAELLRRVVGLMQAVIDQQAVSRMGSAALGEQLATALFIPVLLGGGGTAWPSAGIGFCTRLLQVLPWPGADNGGGGGGGGGGGEEDHENREEEQEEQEQHEQHEQQQQQQHKRPTQGGGQQHELQQPQQQLGQAPFDRLMKLV